MSDKLVRQTNARQAQEDYACGAAAGGVTVHEYNESLWFVDLAEIAGLSPHLRPLRACAESVNGSRAAGV